MQASGTLIGTLDAVDFETFKTDYFEKERPVILRNFETNPEFSEAVARIADEEEALLWHDVRSETVRRIYSTPDLIQRVVEDDLAYLRQKHVRVWLSVKGHRTPWHYDGNSLHVFNLQLRGRKRWRIVSPDTPLICMPFLNIGMFQGGEKRHIEFDMEEGDLLFLPRYWFHSVESVAALNVNLNWVLTPRHLSVNSRTAHREAELMWVLERLYPLLPSSIRSAVDEYAGEGKQALEQLTRTVRPRSGLARGMKEAFKGLVFLVQLPAHLGMYFGLRRSRRRLRSRLETAR